MKPEIAKIWTDALESGEYEQGRLYLCSRNKYCCLGVLCELAIKNGVDVVADKGLGGTMLYASLSHSLPSVVQEWAGMKTKCGVFEKDINTISLADLNDNGRSFAEIAEVIKENVDAL